MKRKALLCAMLALTLLCSAQPAAALTSNQRAIEIEGLTRLPVVDITVPSGFNVIINPYEMPVTVNNGVYRDPIVCTPTYLVSHSDAPIRVDVSVTGSVYEGSDLSLVPSPTNGVGTEKNAFVYFEMVKSNAYYWGAVQWESGYTNKSNQVLVAEGTSTVKQEVAVLPAVTSSNGLLPDNARAWFRLSGDAVKTPTSGWNNGDGIRVVVVFTFTPLHFSNNP